MKFGAVKECKYRVAIFKMVKVEKRRLRLRLRPRLRLS
jgi:hypothetical protein